MLILALSFYGIEAAVSAYSTSSDDLELLIPSFVVSVLNQVRGCCAMVMDAR